MSNQQATAPPSRSRSLSRVAALSALVAVALTPLVARATTSRAASIVDEIGHIRGLDTYARLLGRSDVGDQVERSRETVVLFAFTDQAWKSLAVIDNGSGMVIDNGSGMDRKQLARVMGMHAVRINVGRSDRAGDTSVPYPRLHFMQAAKTLLGESRVRTLGGESLPVAEHARGAARVIDAHALRDGHVVVFVIDRVLFSRRDFAELFPKADYGRAPVSSTVVIPDPDF